MAVAVVESVKVKVKVKVQAVGRTETLRTGRRILRARHKSRRKNDRPLLPRDQKKWSLASSNRPAASSFVVSSYPRSGILEPRRVLKDQTVRSQGLRYLCTGLESQFTQSQHEKRTNHRARRLTEREDRHQKQKNHLCHRVPIALESHLAVLCQTRTTRESRDQLKRERFIGAISASIHPRNCPRRSHPCPWWPLPLSPAPLPGHCLEVRVRRTTSTFSHSEDPRDLSRSPRTSRTLVQRKQSSAARLDFLQSKSREGCPTWDHWRAKDAKEQKICRGRERREESCKS